jgi:hypothetical protein
MIHLIRERYIRELDKRIKIKGHSTTMFEAIGTLEYTPRVDRVFDYDGLSDALIRFIVGGKGLVKVGTKRNLDHYHNLLNEEGGNWNPDSQKCLCEFSYGVSAGML